MTNELNRRDALRFVGLTAGAFLTGSVANRAAAEEVATPLSAAAVSADKPAWKYAVVDPNRVADLAYSGYSVGRCMFTTFQAIVWSVAEALEKTDPIAADAIFRFPFHMMRYGDSGANGWGSLCGSLNGAMAAISLFTVEKKTRSALCDEIANYYAQTMLPIYQPKDAEDETPFAQTISGSIICHVSSGKWANLVQVRTDSPERSERCTRLSADIAKKTVELLNLNVAALTSSDVKPIVELKRPEDSATCGSCHDKGGTNSDIIGKMDCAECHPEQPVDHHSATAN